MHKLLATLLLSVLPLTASANENVLVINPGFVYDNPIAGNGALFINFTFGATTFSDYALSYASIGKNGELTNWFEVLNSAGCPGQPDCTISNPNGGLHLPLNEAPLVFKLVAEGNTYYAGIDGLSNAAAVFDYNNTGKTVVTFGTPPVFGDFNFTMTYVAQGSPLPAVPEPEAYAMLLAGLTLVGTVARRRKLS